MEAVESAQTAGFIQRIDAGHERLALIRSLPAPVLEIVGSPALVLFLLVGGHRVETGHLTPGTLATLASCLLAVSFLLRNVGTAQVTASMARAARATGRPDRRWIAAWRGARTPVDWPHRRGPPCSIISTSARDRSGVANHQFGRGR